MSAAEAAALEHIVKVAQVSFSSCLRHLSFKAMALTYQMDIRRHRSTSRVGLPWMTLDFSDRSTEPFCFLIYSDDIRAGMGLARMFTSRGEN